MEIDMIHYGFCVAAILAMILGTIFITKFFSELFLDEDVSLWAFILGIIAFIVGPVLFTKSGIQLRDIKYSKPIVIESVSTPKIDTTITIKNGIADTTYIFTFPNKGVGIQ